MGTFLKKHAKKRVFKLPVAVLVCVMLVIGGGLAYKAMALDGINITTPIAGEYWSGEQGITWGADCEASDTVNIYYSIDGFVLSSVKIAENINCENISGSNAGFYLWDTTDVIDGSSYSIKVRDSIDPDVYDTSGAFTIDNTDPTSVVIDNLGIYQTNATFNITYTASDNLSLVDYVELYYSKDEAEFVKYEGAFTTGSILFDSSTAGGDGVYEFYTVATDNAGNVEEAPATADASTIVDTTLPTIANITSEVINGSYKEGETIDIDVTFSEIVTSTGNVTVTLETGTIDQTCVFTLTNTDTGTCDYIVQANDVSADLNVLSVTGTIKDVAGNVMIVSVPESGNNLADNKDIIIDTAKPTVLITSSENGTATNENPIPVTITFNEEVVGFEITDIAVGNGAANNFVSTANPEFTVDIIPSEDGTVTVDVLVDKVMDLAGNLNTASNNFSIIYDGTAPTFTVNDDVSEVWVGSDNVKFTIDYTTSGANSTKYVLTSGTCVAGDFTGSGINYTSGDILTFNNETDSGKYLCLEAGDKAGNFGYESVGPFMIDTAVATIAINDDASTSYVQSDDIKFTVGYTTSGAGDTEYVLTGGTCVIDDFTSGGTAYASGISITFNTEASDDGKYVCLRARDGKGNQEGGENYTYKMTGQLKIDRTNPVVTIDAVTTPTKINTQTITGTFVEAHISGITVNEVVATLGDGTYSATVNLTEGDNLITVIATDVAENAGTNAGPVTINLDITIPTIENLLPENNSIINDNTPTISANLDDNSGIDASTIVVTVDSNTVNHTFSNSVVSYTSTELTDSQHTVTIDVDDNAGNPAIQEISTFTVDTKEPTGTVSLEKLIIFDGDLIQEVTVTYNEPMDTESTPIIAFGTTVGTITSNGNGVWASNTEWEESFTTTDANEETTGVTVSSSNATDIAGNVEDINATPIPAFDVDTKNPAPIVVVVNSINKINLVQTVVVTYDETMDTSTVPAIVLTGNYWGGQITVGWTTTTEADDTYTATFTHSGTEEEIFDAVASVSGAKDVAGNNGIITGTSATFVIDTKAPTVAITSTEPDPTNSSSFQVTITFSEEVSDFVVGDIAVGNGTVNNFDSTNNPVFTANITPTGSAVIVDIAANVATDLAGNGNIVAPQFSITYDGTAPVFTSVAVSDPDEFYKAGDNISFDVNLGETGLIVAADLTVLDTALSSIFTLTDDGDNTYSGTTAGLSADTMVEGADIAVTFTATDTAENSATNNLLTLTIDKTAPTTSDDYGDKNDVWQNASQTITLIPTDAISGVASTKYCMDINNTCNIANGSDYTDPVVISTEGITYFRYASVDKAGNIQETVSKIVKIDTIDPTIIINSVTTPTNIATQTITGIYTETNLGTIKVNDVVATVSETTYTAEIPLPTEGNNAVAATITDLAGRTVTVTTNIVLDTQAPTVNAGADKTVNAIFTQDAIVTDSGTGIASYLWTNESTDVGTITFGSANAEDTTILATNGIYIIRLTVVDNAGNSASDTMELIWDDEAPTVVITAPLTGTKVNGNAVIIFTDDELTSPQCSVDDTAWTACTSGTTKLSNIAGFSTVVEGASFTLYLKDTDTAGNIGTDNEAGIIKDTVTPTITGITSNKANGSYTVGEVIDIEVTFSEEVTSDEVLVTLNTGGICTFTVDNFNTGTCNYTVAIGENTDDLDTTVFGIIIDEAGNEMEIFTPTLADNKDIVIDTEAPILQEEISVITPTNDSTPDYTFSSTEVGAIIYGDSCSSLTTDATVGNNAITFNELADGAYDDCTITVTDSAGNPSMALPVTEFTVDTTAPEITNLIPTHTSVTSDTTPTISTEFIENGSGVDIDSVVIIVDGVDQTDYSTVTTNGVTYTPIIPLLAGTYEITVNVDDMVDNSANQASWSFIVNPLVTTITVSSDKASLPADGASHAVITAQILDNGEPVEYAVVNFAATIGTLSGITASDTEGRATAELTSIEAGQTTVTASYNSDSGLVQGTVSLTFTEVITDTEAPTATQYPADDSVDVPIDVHPYIDFSEAMDEDSLTTDNIQLRKCSGMLSNCTSGNVTTVSATLNAITSGGITTVTITPDIDLANNTHYYFYIDADVKDLADNSLNPTWTSTNRSSHEFTTAPENHPVESYDISLNAGWNLISLPLIPENSDIIEVLDDATSSVDIVWSYGHDESGNGVWDFYKPENGSGNLTTMEDGKGYWIFMSGNSSTYILTITGTEMPQAVGDNPPAVPSYSLVDGDWNLIGFKSVNNMTAGDYIGNFTERTLNDSSILWNYKNGSYPSQPLDASDDMEPGYGYWLYMK